MALANPMILYPVRFAATSYVLRVTLDATAEDLPFPASGSLTVGRNYWFSGDDVGDTDGGEGGVGDLVRMLELALSAHSVGGTWTVALTADRELTVTHSAEDFTLHWGHVNSTLPEHLFGAPNADSSSASSTLTLGKPVIGHWLPGQPWQGDSLERLDVSSGMVTTLSGDVYRERLTERRRPRKIDWTLLPESRVIEASGDMAIPANTDATQTDTFEYLWRGALSWGYPIRVYEDEADSGTYDLYLSQSKDPTWDRDEQYRLRWMVSLDLRETGAIGSGELAGQYDPPMISALPRSDFAATRAPTGSDNAAAGWSAGSHWLYDGTLYIYTGSAWITAGGSSYAKLGATSRAWLSYYDFESALTDQGSLNLTLSASSTAEYAAMHGLTGIRFLDQTIQLTSSYAAGLALTGDFTLHCLISTHFRRSDNTKTLAGLEASGPVYYGALDTPYNTTGLGWFHTGDVNRSCNRFLQISKIHLLTVRRQSNTIYWIVDGTELANVATSACSATGNARWIIGAADASATNQWEGMLFNLAFIGSALSDAQILADAQACGVAP